jgi:hypothetical protein
MFIVRLGGNTTQGPAQPNVPAQPCDNAGHVSYFEIMPPTSGGPFTLTWASNFVDPPTVSLSSSSSPVLASFLFDGTNYNCISGCAGSGGGGGVTGGSLTIAAGTQAANSCVAVATVTDTGLTTSGAFSRPTIAYSGSTSGLTGWDAASPGMKLNFFTSSANTMGYEICNYSSSSIIYSAITFQLGAS